MLYFGYGSLVNRNTRDASEPFLTASLHGWERHWAHQARRPWRCQNSPAASHKPGLCALTAAVAADSIIEGVIGHIDDAQVGELDQREAGYHRVSLPATAFQCESPLPEARVSVYVSELEHKAWADANYPIPLSYVECVLAGFRQQFGDAGARRFMQSTVGWDKPIYDDRQAALYPRAVTLSAAEQSLIDGLLNEFTQ